MNQSNLGFISKVEPFGLVDGPGIRVVFFLSGCPLRCLYCHNPETWAYQQGNTISPNEVLETAKRYQPYFGQTGGVTFSGGEPLSQPEFLLECLTLLKEQGIHTALDTSGVGNPQLAMSILKKVDLVIYDMKAVDPDLYQRITSQKQTMTQNFLKLVQELEVPLWIRQVIVPELNDDPKNLVELAKAIAVLRNVEKVELLPYHTMGTAKYDKLNIAYPLTDTPAMDVEITQKMNQKLIEMINRLRNEMPK